MEINQILPKILIFETKGVSEELLTIIFKEFILKEIKNVILNNEHNFKDPRDYVEIMSSQISLSFISKESFESKELRNKTLEHINEKKILERQVSRTIVFFHSEKLFHLLIGKKTNGENFNFMSYDHTRMDDFLHLKKPTPGMIIFDEYYNGGTLYTKDKKRIEVYSDYINEDTLDSMIDIDPYENLFIKTLDTYTSLKDYNINQQEIYDISIKNFEKAWISLKLENTNIFHNFFNESLISKFHPNIIEEIINQRYNYVYNNKIENPNYNKKLLEDFLDNPKSIVITDIFGTDNGFSENDSRYEEKEEILFLTDKIKPFIVNERFDVIDYNIPGTTFYNKLKNFLFYQGFNKIDKPTDNNEYILYYSKLMIEKGVFIEFPNWLNSKKIIDTFKKFFECNFTVDFLNYDTIKITFLPENRKEYSIAKTMFSNFIIYNNEAEHPETIINPLYNYRLILNKYYNPLAKPSSSIGGRGNSAAGRGSFTGRGSSAAGGGRGSSAAGGGRGSSDGRGGRGSSAAGGGRVSSAAGGGRGKW